MNCDSDDPNPPKTGSKRLISVVIRKTLGKCGAVRGLDREQYIPGTEDDPMPLMLSRLLSRCLNFERLKFAARPDRMHKPKRECSGVSSASHRRFDLTFSLGRQSCVRTRSQGWRIGSAISDHAPSCTHRHDQRAQTHREGESQRRRDACAVEGATGVCYSIWFGAWRSLVAHLPWEQGVGRSNRLAPTSRQ